MSPAEAKAFLTSPADTATLGGADTLTVSFRDPAHHMGLTLNVKDGHFSLVGDMTVATRTLLARAELIRRAVDFIHKARLKPR